ncbi:hypothetical protein GCM10023083_52490 [Streptomyces phyllanthi]
MPPEPAEELLRAVCGQHTARPQTEQQQAQIASVENGHDDSRGREADDRAYIPSRVSTVAPITPPDRPPRPIGLPRVPHDARRHRP